MQDVKINRAKKNGLSMKDVDGYTYQYPILAYDVETDSDGNFVYAHVYGKRGVRVRSLNPNSEKKYDIIPLHVDIGCHSIEELCRAICGDTGYQRILDGKGVDKNNRIPAILVAYNYKYDYPYIMSITDDSKVLWGSGGFIAGRLKNGMLMIDLTNHTQKRSLEEIIKVMGLNEKGIQKYELEENPNERELRCRDDARATYELGVALQKLYYEQWGAKLMPTIASQAMRIYRIGYFDYSFLRQNEECELNLLERKAYYGGRTECFRRGMYEVHSFDVKSMYPSIMRDCLMPDPETAKYIENGKHYRKDYDTDDPGIYHVRVFVPKQVVGLLPHHNADNQLVFPCGTFEGWYVKEELKAAEHYGAKILLCYDYVRYSRKIDLFSRYITDMYRRRSEHPSGSLYNMMFKILMNSLYGKFAQKNPIGGFTGKLEDYAGDMGDGTKINFTTVNVMGEDCVNIAAQEYEDAYSAFPCIAVYITALARVKLLHKLMFHADSVVYCDTDSIKYQAWDVKDEDGHELGEWEWEYTKTQVFVRPKLYWDVNMASLKAKGIKTGGYPPIIWNRLPTPEEDKQRYTHVDKSGKPFTTLLERFTVICCDDDGIHARFYKPTGIKEGIKQKRMVNQWTRQEKTLSWGDTKRFWLSAPDISDDRMCIASSESFPAHVNVGYTKEFLSTLYHRYKVRFRSKKVVEVKRYRTVRPSYTEQNTAKDQIERLLQSPVRN